MSVVSRYLSFVFSTLVLFVGIAISSAGAQEIEPTDLSEAMQGLRFGGHIHAIGTYLDQERLNDSDQDASDINVNSTELYMSASPSRTVDANVTWLREEEFDAEDKDSFDVDQAYVVLSGNSRVLTDRKGRGSFDVNPLYVKAGKFYVPFTTPLEYHTFDVISEPQALGLSETNETAFQLGFAPHDGLNSYIGVFRGDGSEGSVAGDDANDVYAGIEYDYGPGSLSAHWMSNLNNVGVLTEEIGDTGVDRVGGLGLYGSFESGPALLQVAHLRSLDDLEEVGSDTRAIVSRASVDEPNPSATTVELTYSDFGSVLERSLTGTLVYERTDEWVDHPENVYGAVLDVPIINGVTGSMEYIQREYDSDFSTGPDREELVSFRMAVGFEELLTGVSDE